jgi:hypothetical protein
MSETPKIYSAQPINDGFELHDSPYNETVFENYAVMTSTTEYSNSQSTSKKTFQPATNLENIYIGSDDDWAID